MLSAWACLILLVSPTMAYYNFVEQIPNANNVLHPCKANYRWQGVGHESPRGGGVRNAFGKDFKDIGGYKWTQRLCEMDSDGDGRTNGEELGDPDCVWRPGTVPSSITDITHPGVCEPYGQGICAGRDNFVECNEVTFEECSILNESDVQTLEFRFPVTTVPPTETNYFAMTFDVPSDQDYHLVAYEALIDNRDVMHHIVVSGCTDDAEAITKPQLSGMDSNKCFNIIGLWTVGIAGNCLGDSIGFRLGKTAYKRIKLEFHYNNPKLRADYTDSSGMKFYIRPARPEVADLATFTVGQRLIEIPPGQKEVKIEGSCTSSCTRTLFTKPVYVTQAVNHMHYLGSRMKVEIYRNGKWLLDLTNDERYNYDSPVINKHDPPIELLPGDEIRTECVYNSQNNDKWVYYGDGTQDEMCYAFIFLYPADHTPYTNWCVAQGPVSTCDAALGTPIDRCNWAEFINTSHPTHRTLEQTLAKNCNLDGFCRPECHEATKEIKDHPCLNGEVSKFVKEQLQESEAGLKMLGRLYSCQHGTTTPKPTDCREECKDMCPPVTGGYSEGIGNDVGSQRGFTALVLTMTVVTSLAALFY